jgi:hypothetical protein
VLRSPAAPKGITNHFDVPCDQLPDPAVQAPGIDKKCPPGGSSSGVAKGDFNGDGFADLAIGEPGATVDGYSSAGDVIVIYGSSGGLTTNTPGIPAGSSGTRDAYQGVPIRAIYLEARSRPAISTKILIRTSRSGFRQEHQLSGNVLS